MLFGSVYIWLWKQTPKHHLPYVHDEVAAFKQAREQHKLVMIDFSADWCNPCHAMERAFGTDDIYDAITKNFVPLKFDVTETNDLNDALKAKYKAQTLPAVLFIDPDTGKVYQRIRGELEPDKMLEVIKSAAARDVSLKKQGC